MGIVSLTISFYQKALLIQLIYLLKMKFFRGICHLLCLLMLQIFLKRVTRL